MESRKPGSAVIGVVLVIALLWFIVFGNMGCTFATKNNGKFVVSCGTTVSIGSETAQTAPEEAYSKTDFPALEDWIKSKATPPKDTEEAPAPPS